MKHHSRPIKSDSVIISSNLPSVGLIASDSREERNSLELVKVTAISYSYTCFMSGDGGLLSELGTKLLNNCNVCYLTPCVAAGSIGF